MNRLNQMSSNEIKNRREAIRQQRLAADKKSKELEREKILNRQTEAEAYAKVKGITVERAKLILFSDLIKVK